MRGLWTVRDDWDERRRFEGRILRAMTIFESVEELEMLYRDFGRHLEETEPDLNERRAQHVSTLQDRLARAGGCCLEEPDDLHQAARSRGR